MSGEIIRLGDKTDHGGTVIEGSQFDICMGKPIAFVGHKVQCPKCKGTYPIVEGAPATLFYGKGVALAGMRTSCGAVLIASQFTDVVEIRGGSQQGRASEPTDAAVPSAASPAASAGSARKNSNELEQFDDRFVLIDDSTGRPIAFTEYAIRRESGEVEFGTTDAKGHTHLLSATTKAELIEIYV